MPEGGRAEHGRPRVKICGLTNADDARAAVAAGADYVGVVVTPGFGRSVEPEQAAEVLADVALPRVAVVVDQPPETVAAAAETIRAAVIQLHGAEDAESVRELRGLGPWRVWKAVRARSVDDVAAVVATLGDHVDGILVEGWKEGVVGGGGVRLHAGARAVRDAVPSHRTFVLAGGLTPENVADAVARFRPDVVDVSSGVERAERVKDADRIRAFVRAVRALDPDPSENSRPEPEAP